MIFDELNEGDFVIITSGEDGISPGWIMKYHARGEQDLTYGLVWIDSGRYFDLSNAQPHLLRSLTRICELQDIPKKQPSFNIMPLFMTRHERAAKREKTVSSGSSVPHVSELDESMFQLRGNNKTLFTGSLNLTRRYKTLHGIISDIESNGFILTRKKNAEVNSLRLRKFLKDAAKKREEGVWMNPAVSIACLKHFGIPKAYFKTGRKLVSDYNQLIIQVDGTDSARTLGMHKDRDSEDKPVNTILGCVAGDGGKDVILWLNSANVDEMPRWWRNEGMSRESFELAKLQCEQSKTIKKQTSVLTLNPGMYIFMPKNTYHWVCPSESATWTVMVTSSFY
jgi:hypothetical protein